MNRKQVLGIAKNAAGEGQPSVGAAMAEARGNQSDQTKGPAKKVAGGLWNKPATLDQTLKKMDSTAS
jgi:hypothetical protein